MSREPGEREGPQGASSAVPAVGDATPAATPGKGTLVGGEGATPTATKAKVKHETDQATPDGTAKTRATVAIGELVYFTAEDVDAGTWSTAGGTGKADGLNYDWRAPSSPGSATITFDPGGGAAPTTVTMKVIAPDSITYSDKKEMSFGKGQAGAGMTVKLTFLPLSVCFWGTQWRETAVDASGVEGWFKPIEQTLKHKPASPRDIGSDNSGPGDKISYTATPPFKDKGKFTWDIPQQVSVKGASNWVDVKKFAQVTSIEPDGTLTVSKNGESVTRSP